jgi:hypothetical protein
MHRKHGKQYLIVIFLSICRQISINYNSKCSYFEYFVYNLETGPPRNNDVMFWLICLIDWLMIA